MTKIHDFCEWMTLTSLFLTRRRILFILFLCCNVKSCVILFDASKMRRSNVLRCLTVPGCWVSFLSGSECYVQGCPEFLKAFAETRLREYIRKHFLGGYALNCNRIGVDVMLQVMMPNVDVYFRCFVGALFEAMSIADLLSMWCGVGSLLSICVSCSSFRSQIMCLVAAVAPMYSTSVAESGTKFCLREFQEIGVL